MKACDTAFGVTKEQRNLFTVAGIDGHNKMFITMRCFIPSKEIKVYYWAIRTALQYLVTDTTLSFNQYIAYDYELAIYQTLGAMMDNVPCLNTFRNRLENYHVLTQRCNASLLVSVSGKEAKSILKYI